MDSGGAGGNRETEGDNTAPLGGQSGGVENPGSWGSTDEVGLGDNEGAAPGGEGRRDLGHQQTQ